MYPLPLCGGSAFLPSFHCPLLSHETLWPFLAPMSHCLNYSTVLFQADFLGPKGSEGAKRKSKLPLGRELHLFPAQASSYPPGSPLRDEHGGNTIFLGQTNTSQWGGGVGNSPGLVKTQPQYPGTAQTSWMPPRFFQGITVPGTPVVCCCFYTLNLMLPPKEVRTLGESDSYISVSQLFFIHCHRCD